MTKTSKTSPTIKILGEIQQTAKRPRGLHHSRAARRTAEASARQIASGRCSSALQLLIAARESLVKAEYTDAAMSDRLDALRDVNAVETAFVDRCVVKTAARH